MTNKEAINRLEDLIGGIGNEVILDTVDYEAIRLAINILENQMSELIGQTSDVKEILDNEPIPKKKKFHISDMDITFDNELTCEEMELRFFGALRNAGVIGHRGCPH